MDRRPPGCLLDAVGLGLSLDAAAERLYAGEPASFVSARDAEVKAARAAGDRALATAIGKLRRPSTAAWYVNVAARAPLLSLREWLTLGSSLREAQQAWQTPRVRELSQGRAALENRVIRDLTVHLGTLGVTASQSALLEVRNTLRAALADAAASDAVAAGRLDKALSYGGFGEVDLSSALAAMASRVDEDETTVTPDAAPEPQPTGPDPALVAALQQARETLASAEAVHDEADAGVGAAEASLAVAQRTLREAKAARARSDAAVKTARAAVASAEDALAD